MHCFSSIPGGSDGKVSVYNAGDPGLSPGLGRSPGEGNGNPLQYYCLENPMDRGAWQAAVYGVTKSWTWLSDFTSLVRSLQPPDVLLIHWRVYNSTANTSKGVLFLPPSEACVRSFLYLLYTLIKLYYTKALSDQALSLAPDWILLLQRPRIPASFHGSATTFYLFDHFQFTLIHGPNIPGSYAILFFTALDSTSITSHIHNWALFLLWLHLFFLSGVISPQFSNSISGIYRNG